MLSISQILHPATQDYRGLCVNNGEIACTTAQFASDACSVIRYLCAEGHAPADITRALWEAFAEDDDGE